ncbi:MAG: PAS domain-containing protein [Chloroflexi bacterium]|nr:PAS domain-containing protein [Chloroflexota bacterium]
MGVAVLDASGYIVSANQALIEVTGYARDELHGLHLKALFPGVADALATVDKSSARWKGEAELVRKDGSKLPLTVGITPAKDGEGGSLGFVVVLRGVFNGGASDNGTLDETEVRLREFEHELRNVFTVIAGNVSMMNGSVEDPNLRRRLTIMQTAVRSGMDILDKIRRASNA